MSIISTHIDTKTLVADLTLLDLKEHGPLLGIVEAVKKYNNYLGFELTDEEIKLIADKIKEQI